MQAEGSSISHGNADGLGVRECVAEVDVLLQVLLWKDRCGGGSDSD